MSTFVVKNRPLWLGSYNLAQWAHSMAIDYGAETQDATTLDDLTRVMVGGLKTFGFSCDVYLDFAANTPFGGNSSEVFDNIGGAVPLTVSAVDGSNQDTAYLVNARQLVSSPLSGAVGEMAGSNISGNSASPLARGMIGANETTAASGQSAAMQLGAVSDLQAMLANLHVTAAAGTNIDVVVQSDDNAGFTTPTDRILFSSANGVTSEHMTTQGAITDDYWRVVWTITGGSFTFAVSLGIA